jgi:glucokinase
MILAGDVGGTKANLGLFDVQQGELVRVVHKRYASHEHKGLEEIVSDFYCTTREKATAACFGIAGPVVDYKVHTGNLPWIVDGATLARQLGLERVRLLNDLEATAYGLNMMKPTDLETLYQGVPAAEAHQAVIAAGTGLGEAILFWDGSRHIPIATEAGHSDFAPHTYQQAELWKYMKARHDLVSVELVLSGRGFQTLHEFLNPGVKHDGFDDPSVDPAPEITRRALANECPVCVDAVNLWIEIYGSEAGNLTVRCVARGGVFVAGGIAVKILPMLNKGKFAATMREKEKMGDFLKMVPIHVILDEECPLKGAAFVAWKGW